MGRVQVRFFNIFFIKIRVVCLQSRNIYITKCVFLPFSFLFQETDCITGGAFLTGVLWNWWSPRWTCNKCGNLGFDRGWKYQQRTQIWKSTRCEDLEDDALLAENMILARWVIFVQTLHYEPSSLKNEKTWAEKYVLFPHSGLSKW